MAEIAFLRNLGGHFFLLGRSFFGFSGQNRSHCLQGPFLICNPAG